jgi:hypothetical protein
MPRQCTPGWWPRRTPPWHQPSSRHVAENPVAGSAQAPIGWNVWLIGGSERWAAGTILVLGSFTCGLGSPGKDAATKLLAVLGIAAGALGVLALVTGSLTALSFLTLDIVLLWGASMIRHSRTVVPAHGAR